MVEENVNDLPVENGELKVTLVKFVKPMLPYNIGEVAGFTREMAERLVVRGIGKYANKQQQVTIAATRGVPVVDRQVKTPDEVKR